MGNLAASHEFGIVHFIESSLVVSSLTNESILLIVRDLVENRYPVIGCPAKKEILVGIDSSPFFHRLFEGGIENRIVLRRGDEVILLCRAGCHNPSSNSKI